MTKTHKKSTTPTLLRPKLHLPELENWVSERVYSVGAGYKVQQKIDQLMWMLQQSYFRLRPHDDPLKHSGIVAQSTPDQFFGASSFHVDELRDALGGSRGDYKKYIRLFWDFAEGNEGYNHYIAPDHPFSLDEDVQPPIKNNDGIIQVVDKEGQTKVYVLKSETIKTLDDFWRSDLPGVITDKDTGQVLSAADLPANGIARTSHSKLAVPSLVKLDRNRLDQYINEEETKLQAPGMFLVERYRRAHTLRWLYVARKWINTIGGLPNLYKDYDQIPADGYGRLYGIGEMHLQTMPREARAALLKGSGWWSYDFSACHPTIAQALARSYNIDTLALDYYLDNQEECREQISEDTQVHKGKIKRIINSYNYGQFAVAHSENSLFREVLRKNYEQLVAVRDHPFLVCMQCDLLNVRDEAVRRHRQGDEMVNAVGKRLPIYEEDEEGNSKKMYDRRLLSHVLTGYESWAVNTVCKDRDDLQVILHDGWIGEKERDVQEMQDHIREKSERELHITLSMNIKTYQL